MFLIPKKNSTLNGSVEWKSMIKDFLLNTVTYLEQYHKRSNSESGFAADKKMLGQNVAQRGDDRIDSAIFCTGLWHNIFNIGRSQNNVPHPTFRKFLSMNLKYKF